jgi:hypothetical protein
MFVLSGRGLCDGPIPRPEESYRLWCVSECDQVQNKIPRHLLRVGRRGRNCETIRVILLGYSPFCGAGRYLVELYVGLIDNIVIFDLLGYYAAWIGSYRRFGTTYWSHPQASSSPKTGVLDPECKGTTIFRNVGHCVPVDTA